MILKFAILNVLIFCVYFLTLKTIQDSTHTKFKEECTHHFGGLLVL